jgi:hypothetical protein
MAASPGRRRILIAAGSALAAALIAGCGGGDGGGDPEGEIRAQLEKFKTAANERDFETICDEVIAPAAKAALEALGGPCPEEFAEDTPEGTEIEEFSVDNVEVEGDGATVDLTFTTDGQKESQTRIFVKVDGEWRLDFTP